MDGFDCEWKNVYTFVEKIDNMEIIIVVSIVAIITAVTGVLYFTAKEKEEHLKN